MKVYIASSVSDILFSCLILVSLNVASLVISTIWLEVLQRTLPSPLPVHNLLKFFWMLLSSVVSQMDLPIGWPQPLPQTLSQSIPHRPHCQILACWTYLCLDLSLPGLVFISLICHLSFGFNPSSFPACHRPGLAWCVVLNVTAFTNVVLMQTTTLDAPHQHL